MGRARKRKREKKKVSVSGFFWRSAEFRRRFALSLLLRLSSSTPSFLDPLPFPGWAKEARKREAEREGKKLKKDKTNYSLVHHDPVVVLPARVSAASRMLAVLSNTAVARGDVAALLAVLAEA